MARPFALAALLLTAAVAAAEPLPWNYTVTMKPANGADVILLGREELANFDDNGGFDPGPQRYVFTGGGGQVGDTTTPTDAVTLFVLPHGGWQADYALPAGAKVVTGRFTLEYLFADAAGYTASGSVDGGIGVSPIYYKGGGLFGIGLDKTVDVDLAGRRAKVRFGDTSNDSYAGITMQVTPLTAETPEPGTLALGGIGLAGVLGVRWKRRRCVHHGMC